MAASLELKSSDMRLTDWICPLNATKDYNAGPFESRLLDAIDDSQEDPILLSCYHVVSFPWPSCSDVFILTSHR